MGPADRECHIFVGDQSLSINLTADTLSLCLIIGNH